MMQVQKHKLFFYNIIIFKEYYLGYLAGILTLMIAPGAILSISLVNLDSPYILKILRLSHRLKIRNWEDLEHLS